MPTPHSHSLLTLLELTPERLRKLLALAAELKKRRHDGVRGQLLHRRNIALLFEKPSTRTRCAFVVACQDEGGHAECLNAADVHLGAKESVADTARVLSRMFDGIMFRGFAQETVQELARHSRVPVWNGLTDLHHPTQALADLLTLEECFTKLSDIKLVYLGDGANNVAHSLLAGAALTGMRCVIACPPTRTPDAFHFAACTRLAQETGARLEVSHNPDEAVRGAHALSTDVWLSMGEENVPDAAARLEALRPFQLNGRLLEATGKRDTVVLHCLPARQGFEITSDIFESAASRVFEQAENRLHTIKALLVDALRQGENDDRRGPPSKLQPAPSRSLRHP